MHLDQAARLSSSSVECCFQCKMFSPLVFYGLSTLIAVYCNTVTSPQIKILDVATKASETRLIPNRVGYRNSYRPQFQSSPYPHRNRFQQNEGPLKSYVIYDEYPLKVFREWKTNAPADFSSPAPQSLPDLNKQPNVDFATDYYYRSGQQILSPPKPTLAYRSVYSNVIKVFDNSLENVNRDRFSGNRYFKPFEIWKPQIDYQSVLPQEISYRKQKLPANFPKVFSSNENFYFPIDDELPQPPKFFYPEEGFYDTNQMGNHNQWNNQRRPDEVETLPEVNSSNRPFLCGFIRVNQNQFPENGPCGKSDDDITITLQEYPDYSNFPNDKIPVEHRRQHFQMKRIKRSGWNETYDSRQKRDAGLGYSSWGSPFGYESSEYDGYYSSNYPNKGYSRNRERSQSYRNRYSSRYDDYDDDYQNSDYSNSRGLTGYLTNGGRRYKNRKSNEDDEDDEYNTENNRDEDSEEEMERMNSNRRDNDRRNNDDSRDRRRNNNNNSNNNNNNDDDDDYRDNRRNRNNRRNNSNRRYNDRYDKNSRNRYYGNSNGYGYNNNGYGNSYLGYGTNYGGYGSGGYGSGGYGSGGYGSSYGSNGGYGYGGGYGNFGSF